MDQMRKFIRETKDEVKKILLKDYSSLDHARLITISNKLLESQTIEKLITLAVKKPLDMAKFLLNWVTEKEEILYQTTVDIRSLVKAIMQKHTVDSLVELYTSFDKSLESRESLMQAYRNNSIPVLV